MERYLGDLDLAPDEIRMVVAVFDRICVFLDLDGADPRKDMVAQTVAQIAQTGERDQDRLYRRALDSLVEE